MKMRKRINRRLYFIGGISILLTAIVTILTFYNIFKEQIFDDLELYTEVFQTQDYENNLDEWSIDDLRVTIIEKSGEVIYDSEADVSTMQNHKDRPEFQEALKDGTGKAVRRSDTIGKDTFYYAVKMQDGTVLRIAREVSSVWIVFAHAFPVILLCILVLFVLCLFVSHYLTRQILNPVIEVAENMNGIEEKLVYDELVPFIKKIRQQHADLLHHTKELEIENNKIQMIMNQMSEGLILLDKNLDILTINQSAVELLSLKNVNYSGKNIWHLSRNDELNTCIQEAAKGNGKSIETSLADKQLHFIANPVFVDQDVIGVMCFILDITEKTENERMRREFTANVSHELKTPLTSISGYAELIKEGMVSVDDTATFAGKIYHEAKRLLTLINDIIQLAELDEPFVQATFSEVNLFQLTEECLASLTLNAGKHDVKLNVEGSPSYVFGDHSILEELIFNLCDNAIRYNRPGGSVNVSVYNQNGNVVLTVSDTGIGIPKEHQKRIFERFYRVDKSRSKATGGTGLGLAIVKHIAVQHHATILVNSIEGKGTDITVTFPGYHIEHKKE